MQRDLWLVGVDVIKYQKNNTAQRDALNSVRTTRRIRMLNPRKLAKRRVLAFLLKRVFLGSLC